MPVVPAEQESQLNSGCVGRLGMESFLAPQTITHAAHVKVDRETGVVRVLRFAAAHDSGMILNRIGADGQVLGGVVMGIGQALSEGSMHDEDGRQRNPHLLDYKLVTSADAPADRHPLGRDRHAERRAEGRQGRRRAAVRPDRRAPSRTGSPRVLGRHLGKLPMTPERVWAAANGIEA